LIINDYGKIVRTLLCDGLITHPEEAYHVFVIMKPQKRRLRPDLGCSAIGRKEV
jgi:hypothetical protein